jgi:hypothetical protein
MQDDDLRTQLAACEAETDALRARHGFSKEPEPQAAHVPSSSSSSSSTVKDTPKPSENGVRHPAGADNGGETTIHSPRLAPKSDEFEDDDDSRGGARNDAEDHDVYSTAQPGAHVSASNTHANSEHSAANSGDVGARNNADGCAGDAFDVAAAVAQRDALQQDISALEKSLEQLVAAEDFDTAAIVQTQIEKLQDDLAVVSVSLVGRDMDMMMEAARAAGGEGEEERVHTHESSALGADDDAAAAATRGHHDVQRNESESESQEAAKSSFSFVDEVHAVATGGNGLVSFSIASDGEDAVTHTDTASNADESQWQVHGHSSESADASMDMVAGNAVTDGGHSDNDVVAGDDDEANADAEADDADADADGAGDAHSGDSGMETSSELIETTAMQPSAGDSFVDAEDAATESSSAFSFLS